MSGIAGVFNRNGRPVDRDALQSMSSTVVYRGPDDDGLWSQGPVGLVHRQLRTTQESINECQPVVSVDEDFAVTCDGRVDNREELIQSLRGTAPVSAATPDADLVLYSYIKWGPDCLKHIVGDFAFAVWDGPNQRLFCARDPMGVRTFYYYLDQDRFVFGSDIRAVLLASGASSALNQFMVSLYLLGKFNEGEQTFYNGIFQALPGNSLLVNKDGLKKQVFWEPDPWSPIRYRKTEEYVEHFRQVFNQAVQCRLRSISPVGISLSGGLDSTSIACTAAHLVKEGIAPGVDLQTFSSVFKDFPSVDESDCIRAVSERWDLPGHSICADELWGFKPIQNSDLTLNWPYPMPFQARHESRLSCARDLGSRVMLTGEGGDELLNPGVWYLVDLFKGLHWAQLRNQLRYLTPASRRTVRNTTYQFYKSMVWDLAPGPAKQLYRRMNPRNVPNWLSAEFITSNGALEYEAVVPPHPKSRSLYRQSQYNGCISLPRLPFLPYISEMNDHYGVETRHPFLDRRVIEFLTRVPAHLKLSRNYTKLLLRQAMEGLLPDEVRLRIPKLNFGDVFSHGIQQERSRIHSVLQDGVLVRNGWVKEQGINTLIDRVLAGEPGLNSYFIALVALEEWLSKNFVSNGGGDLANSPRFALDSGQERR